MEYTYVLGNFGDGIWEPARSFGECNVAKAQE